MKTTARYGIIAGLSAIVAVWDGIEGHIVAPLLSELAAVLALIYLFQERKHRHEAGQMHSSPPT